MYVCEFKFTRDYSQRNHVSHILTFRRLEEKYIRWIKTLRLKSKLVEIKSSQRKLSENNEEVCIGTYFAYVEPHLRLSLSESTQSTGALQLTSREHRRTLHQVRSNISFTSVLSRHLWKKIITWLTWIPTSEIQNCGVFHHGHCVPGSAGVIPCVFFLQPLDNISGGINMCLVAVKHPAEVGWRDRVRCAPQGQPPAQRCFWGSDNRNVMWPV